MNKREPETNREWKQWGKLDPLGSVASWPGKRKGEESPWKDEEFYRLGESDWADFSDHWAQYGVNRGSCVEIGCGAGRLTMHLARWFKQVYAIDVSIDMLNYAQEHLKAENVAFQLVDGTKLPQEGNSVDAIFSAHVFQHFKSLEYASLYFSEAWRVLGQAGTLMIHLPILGRQPRAPSLTYLASLVSRQTYELKLGLKRLLAERGWAKPPMASLGYPMEYLFGTLNGLGFRDVEVSTFLTKSNSAIHSFVFARKPAQT